MVDNYITNVLNLLRLIKATNHYDGHSGLHNLEVWSPSDKSRATQMRIASYIVEQCEGAEGLILTSGLPPEAENGLLQIVRSLGSAFHINGIQSVLSNYLPQLDTALSTFAIFASLYAAGPKLSEDADLQSLIVEVETMLTAFEIEGIDPRVRDVAKRHLHVLATMLKNVDALGFDAAMASYAELVIRLRSADAKAPTTTNEEVAPLWERIIGWSETLHKINEAITSSSSLVGRGVDLVQGILG